MLVLLPFHIFSLRLALVGGFSKETRTGGLWRMFNNLCLQAQFSSACWPDWQQELFWCDAANKGNISFTGTMIRFSPSADPPSFVKHCLLLHMN